MTQEFMDNYIQRLNSHRTGLMPDKAKEYATNDDRTWNFSIVAFLMQKLIEARGDRKNVSKAEAALILSFKHLASILQLFKDEPEQIPLSVLYEKFGDLQNYLDIAYSEIRHDKDMYNISNPL